MNAHPDVEPPDGQVFFRLRRGVEKLCARGGKRSACAKERGRRNKQKKKSKRESKRSKATGVDDVVLI